MIRTNATSVECRRFGTLCSVGMVNETKDKRIVPRSSSTHELVRQKDFTLVIPPALTVCR
jgi:hypothetical protein